METEIIQKNKVSKLRVFLAVFAVLLLVGVAFSYVQYRKDVKVGSSQQVQISPPQLFVEDKSGESYPVTQEEADDILAQQGYVIDRQGASNPAFEFRNQSAPGTTVWYFDHDGKTKFYNGTFTENVGIGGNVTASTGYLTWLGSEVSRVTYGYFTNIEAETANFTDVNSTTANVGNVNVRNPSESFSEMKVLSPNGAKYLSMYVADTYARYVSNGVPIEVHSGNAKTYFAAVNLNNSIFLRDDAGNDWSLESIDGELRFEDEGIGVVAVLNDSGDFVSSKKVCDSTGCIGSSSGNISYDDRLCLNADCSTYYNASGAWCQDDDGICDRYSYCVPGGACYDMS